MWLNTGMQAFAAAHIAAAVALAKTSDVAVVGLGLCGDNYWGGGAKEDSTCFAIQETETTASTSRMIPSLPFFQMTPKIVI